MNILLHTKNDGTPKGRTDCALKTSARQPTVWYVAILAVTLALSCQAWALDPAALPTGGQVTGGSGSIDTSGDTMTVTQTSDRMAARWNTFNIGEAAAVDFCQPSAASVALNRVNGTQPSQIFGRLSANGQIFLLNPAGIVFGPTARVDVGGLVASSLSLSDEDFMSGNFTFQGSGRGNVLNQGKIRTADGGYVALIAPKVTNEGSIDTPGGTSALTSGDKVSLDFTGDGLVTFTVDKGTVDALAENQGLIKADGGMVTMTAKAADQLTNAVVNNDGVIEAQTIGEKNGRILLLSDMESGETIVGGRLDASAPNGGDGGFVETSAATVSMSDGLIVTASSAFGRGGEWLIDPYNYTIDATAAGNIATALEGGTSVTVDTAADTALYGSSGSSGDIGDISVESAITKSSGDTDVTLTLNAANSIVVDQPISNTGGTGNLNLTLDADNDSGTGDGAGIILLNADLSTGGGAVNFGTGRTATISGVSTLVGGDVYVAGSGARTISTSGGSVDVQGEMIIANTSGLTINSNGGDVRFYGLLNSGNSYQFTSNSSIFWDAAVTAAKGATGDGSNTGDTYLATITSRLENAIASRVGDYQQSWLGGERTQSVGTDWTWRWVTGPEGLEDSGNGRQFFTQTTGGSGGSAIGGEYTNWSTGEPNGSGTGGSVGEQCLQFYQADARWNDLTNSYTALIEGYTKETNLAASPLTITAGSGSVTFDNAIGNTKSLASLAVTSTNSIAINGGSVTTEGVQTYNGDVTLGAAATTLTQTDADTDFAIQASKSIANAYGSDASLTIKTTGSITMNSGTGFTGGVGENASLVLWSDADGDGDGCVTLDNGSSISTNGGGLWIGGSYGTNSSGSTSWTPYSGATALTVGDGYAVSSGGNYGVLIDRAAIDTDGGNVNVYGLFNDAGTSSDSGLYLTASSLSSSGGNISMEGVNARTNNGTDKATGLEIDGYGSGADSGTSISSGAGDISIVGRLDSGGSFYEAVGLSAGSKFLLTTGAGATGDVSITSTTGSISLEGDSRNISSTRWVHGMALEVQESGDDLTIQSGSGNIDLVGRAGPNASSAHAITLQVKRANDKLKVVSSSGQITLNGDQDTTADVGISLLGASNSNNGTIWLGSNEGAAYTGKVTLLADSFDFTQSWGTISGTTESVNILDGDLDILSHSDSFSGTFALEGSFDFGSSLDDFTVGKSTNTADLNLDNQIVTNGSTPSAAATLSGLQNGDTSGQAVSTAATVAIGGTTSSAGYYTAGSHTMAPSGGAGGLGYGFTYADGTLTVNQKALTVSGITAADKTYDGSTTAVVDTTGASLTGTIVGDTVSIDDSACMGSFVDSSVGTNKTVTISGLVLTGTDADNYSLGTVETTATITSASTSSTSTSTSDMTDYPVTNQSAVNGTQLDQGTQTGPQQPITSMGPGGGSVLLASVSSHSLISGIPESGSSTILSSPHFTTQVSFSSAGPTTRMEIGTSSLDTDMQITGTLPLYRVKNPESAPVIQGSILVRHGEASISVTESAATGAHELPDYGEPVSGNQPFTLISADGVAQAFTASVTNRGTLLIDTTESMGQLDSTQIVLMAMAVLMNETGTDLNDLQAVVLK